MISIITVCHRSEEILKTYVSTFIKFNANANADVEFIFVENSGQTKIELHADELRKNGYPTKVIYTANDGFGTGCNRGAEQAVGDIFVFANPDIEFLSNISLIEPFFMRYGWGTIKQITSQGRTFSFDLLPEYHRFPTEVLRIYYILHRIYKIAGKYLFPIGSFFILKGDLFRSIGGFDERFFLYYEEAELSRRLQKVVGSPAFLNSVAIAHEGLGTQPSVDFALEQEVKSLITYCKITNQPKIIARRMKTLRVLSYFSKIAAKRLRLLGNTL